MCATGMEHLEHSECSMPGIRLESRPSNRRPVRPRRRARKQPLHRITPSNHSIEPLARTTRSGYAPAVRALEGGAST
eukprot:3726613-Prymnesium_polylepis.1